MNPDELRAWAKARLQKIMGGEVAYDKAAGLVVGVSNIISRGLTSLAEDIAENPAEAYTDAWKGGRRGAASGLLRFAELTGAPVEGLRQNLAEGAPDSPSGRLGFGGGSLGPEVGAAGDLAALFDMVDFAKEGNTGMAVLSGASAIPIVGSLVPGPKPIREALLRMSDGKLLGEGEGAKNHLDLIRRHADEIDAADGDFERVFKEGEEIYRGRGTVDNPIVDETPGRRGPDRRVSDEAVAKDRRRTARRLTEQRREIRALRMDAKTGLRGQNEWQRASEAVADDPTRELAIFDITNFKAVNDNLGYAAGDDLLREMADAMRATGRPEATLFRLGGDEFGMIVPTGEGDAIGRQVAEAFGSRNVGEFAVGARTGSGPNFAAADDAMSAAKKQEVGPRNRDVTVNEDALTLRHYSPELPNIQSIDPNLHGTGSAIRGAERARRASLEGIEEFPARSYFYKEGVPPEKELANLPYVDVEVPRSSIATLDEQQDFVQMAKEELRAEGAPLVGNRIATRSERLMKEAGFEGYEGPNGFVAKFTPTPVPGRGLDIKQVMESHAGGGSTFDPRTGRNMASDDAWSVGMFEDRGKVLSGEEMSDEAVQEFIDANQDLLSREGHQLGTWHDKATDTHHLDVVRTFKTKKAATRAAAMNDQGSIWHLADEKLYEPVALERANIREREGMKNPAAVEAEMREALRNQPEKLRELDGMRPKTKERAIRQYLRATPARTLASGALEGASQTGWYKEGARAFADSFGDEAPRFAALAAALSPQKSVRQNLIETLDVWRDWKAAGRPTDPDEIAKLIPTDSAGLDTYKNNTVRALTADAQRLLEPDVAGLLSGPKVDPFYANLTGEVNRIVLDTHMARGLGTNPNDIGGLTRNVAGSAAVGRAADEVGRLTGRPMVGSEGQETVWSTIYGARGGAGRGPVADAIGPMRELDPLLGTTQLQSRIRNSPTFGTMMTEDPEIVRKLAEAGGKPLSGSYAPTGLGVDIPEGTIRAHHLRDIAQRIDAVGKGKQLFSAAGLGMMGAARAPSLFGGEEEESPGPLSLFSRISR